MHRQGCCLAFILCLGPISPCFAEIYVAGEVGAGFPNDLKSVEGTGSIHGVQFSDISFKNTFIYGGKLGYFFDDPSWKWIGMELEVFNSNPHIKQQTVTAAGGGATASTIANGAHVMVTTTALNLVMRYPSKLIEPYAGIGLAFVHAKLSDETGSTSDDSPGLNVLAGLRGFLTKNLAVFGEVKYTYTSFSFENAGATVGEGITGIYSTYGIVGGLSWHFK